MALMIERDSALQQLEDILSVGGVDIVQFCPADYYMSIGVPGQWDHARVKAAERKTIETSLRMGIAARVELPDSEGAEPYIEMGVRHFCIGWDVEGIHEWCKHHGSALAKSLGEKRGKHVLSPCPTPEIEYLRTPSIRRALPRVWEVGGYV